MRDVLSDAGRQRLDSDDDARFYDQPRFVHHVDEGFRDRLARLYADRLGPGDDVLDLMGSWISHLPDVEFGRVVGHGLNAEELATNERYDEWFVQDLNVDSELDFSDESFDAVTCAVSVQYLQYPGRVFAEVARVLRPGGVCVVSFSNRMFPGKAVRAWRDREMDDRADLVSRYLDSTSVFDPPETIREVPGRDPFCAVVAQRRE
ncbi:class I SAM-dependent methyltransferase [Salinirubellus sp. GCM10025818]|uniref:class I SAM-dependent methyltransferase n=1 Tax=Salinirubellus TaxID=2162630 RepID=UPI0030D3581F